jgi:hypothetical protein
MRVGFQLMAMTVTLATVTLTAQAPEWQLASPLTDAEKTRVLSLAATLKIDRPGTIQSEQIHHPLTCDALRIESIPAVDGRRRTFRRAWVTYSSWPASCDRTSAKQAPADTWVVADEVREVGVWRVEVAGSYVDVETPTNIPYGEVAAIVEAVRTGRLVDRMPVGTRVPLRPVPKVDYKSIFVIWQDHQDQSRHAVRFRGNSPVFLVKVQDGMVRCSFWSGVARLRNRGVLMRTASTAREPPVTTHIAAVEVVDIGGGSSA